MGGPTDATGIGPPFLGSMSVGYRILYGIGFTPWEQIALPDAVCALFEREEAGREPPYGTVLRDLGCGSGIWAVKLAQRGWQVTGIDAVPKALQTCA